MQTSLRLAINAIWNSRIQLAITILVVAVLSVGQGKELSLSLQGTLKYRSLLAVLSVGVFVLLLWYWTYISILLAPVRSHRLIVWKTDEEAENDYRLKLSAIYVASAYAGALLLFVLHQFYQIGDAAGAFYAVFTNVILVIYVVNVTTNHDEITLGESAVFNLLPVHWREIALRSRLRRLNAGTIIVALFSLAISPICYFSWTATPDEYAFRFGSFGSVFLSLTVVVPWIFLVFTVCQGFRLPIATLLILAPFLTETVYTSLGLHSHFYAVRSLGVASNIRPSLEKWTDRWKTQEGASTGTRPIVFVTAAGGGIRAAYWTAAVLGRLADCIQDFQKSVFSISSVSGGSLGAAAYVSLVADQVKPYLARSRCRPAIAPDMGSEPMGYDELFLKSFLSQDYLAPVVREMILGDIPRSLAPWAISSGEGTDRGAALEKAWEQAWSQTCKENSCPGKVSFSTPFSALATAPTWLPLLFLNGVHEETGKRIITSTSRITTDYFLDSTDFFDLVQHDVRISTAVLNSARFPIVSPSGALFRSVPLNSSSPPKQHFSSAEQQVGHVIDGGYFDNNGTITSQEVAIGALKSLEVQQVASSCPRVSRELIFIEILNDTTLSELDSDRDNLDNDVSLSSQVQELTRLAPEIPFHPLVVALNGLESSRAARAVHSSKALAKYARSLCGGRYFVMPLCKGIIPQPALGWMLSDESRTAMDRLLIGGIDTRRYANTPSARDFFACYNLIQSNLAEITELLR
jgi:hypothetical protein